MCGSMADIQSATAEIRRGKKQERKNKRQDENVWSALLNRATLNNPQIIRGQFINDKQQ